MALKKIRILLNRLLINIFILGDVFLAIIYEWVGSDRVTNICDELFAKKITIFDKNRLI